MKIGFMAIPLAIAAVAFAGSEAPMGVVSSRAAFSVQGIEAPVVGATDWPVMAGDVIQTKSAPAEVRLKDGTRIFVPPSSRYVVKSVAAARVAASAVAASRQGSYSASTAPGTVAEAHSELRQGVLTILDGGAMVVPNSTLQSLELAKLSSRTADGSTPMTFSMASLLSSFGPTSPALSAISQALQTNGVHIVQSGNTFFIVGVQAVVGDNPNPQPVTLAISPAGLSVYAGTVTSTQNLPPPIVTIPPNTSTPPGCKGNSDAPKDLSNSVITLPHAGSC